MIILSLLLVVLAAVLLVAGLAFSTGLMLLYASIGCSVAALLLVLVAWFRETRTTKPVPGGVDAEGTPIEATWKGAHWGSEARRSSAAVATPASDLPDFTPKTQEDRSEPAEAPTVAMNPVVAVEDHSAWAPPEMTDSAEGEDREESVEADGVVPLPPAVATVKERPADEEASVAESSNDLVPPPPPPA